MIRRYSTEQNASGTWDVFETTPEICQEQTGGTRLIDTFPTREQAMARFPEIGQIYLDPDPDPIPDFTFPSNRRLRSRQSAYTRN